MNKADLVSPAELANKRATFEAIVDDRWRAARGQHHADPQYRPSIAVQNPEGTRWLDAILIDIAKGLLNQR